MTNTHWWKSKTKWASIVGAIGLILPGISDWLLGNGIFPINSIWQAAIVILGVFGIRDALDKKK